MISTLISNPNLPFPCPRFLAQQYFRACVEIRGLLTLKEVAYFDGVITSFAIIRTILLLLLVAGIGLASVLNRLIAGAVRRLEALGPVAATTATPLLPIVLVLVLALLFARLVALLLRLDGQHSPVHIRFRAHLGGIQRGCK